MREEVYGQDILLDETMQAVTAANGEAVVSDGIQTVLQDIRLRLFTPLGSLFYDRNFGSRITDFFHAENTLGNRQALVAEVTRRLNLEPRVEPGTATSTIMSWDHMGITMTATFYLVEEDHPFNFVIEIDEDKEMIIKDVNPNS